MFPFCFFSMTLFTFFHVPLPFFSLDLSPREVRGEKMEMCNECNYRKIRHSYIIKKEIEKKSIDKDANNKYDELLHYKTNNELIDKERADAKPKLVGV